LGIEVSVGTNRWISKSIE